MNKLEPDAPCRIKGCAEPRKVSASGVTYSRCDEHQKAYWRQQFSRRYAESPTYRARQNTKRAVWGKANPTHEQAIKARYRQRKKAERYAQIIGALKATE